MTLHVAYRDVVHVVQIFAMNFHYFVGAIQYRLAILSIDIP